MRIGFDAHVLDGRDQGIKTLMLRLIEAAAQNHKQHDFFVYSEKPHPELNFSQENLHFRPVSHAGAISHLMRSLPRIAKKDELDTIVFNFISSPLIKNATVLIHDILPQTHAHFFTRRFAIRCWVFFGQSTVFARNILTISEHSRDEIKRVYPWTRKRDIEVMHIGPSFTEELYFANEPDDVPPSIAEWGNYALCVGRMEPRKNVQLAIDAFHVGAPRDARLVIVGRREPGIAIELYDDSRIIELAGVSDEDLVEIYRNASLFIYPSVAEGFGLPLLDAILFGIPVIASRLTSMKEVGGDCATFFDPSASDAADWLTQRIRLHFGTDPVPKPNEHQRRERLSRYSWSNAASELITAVAAHHEGRVN